MADLWDSKHFWKFILCEMKIKEFFFVDDKAN